MTSTSTAALDFSRFECFIDREGISGGEEWKRSLGGLISEADTVVFVLTPNSARSAICDWEVEEATRLNKRILPIVCRPLEGVSPPPRLRDLNYIFFYKEPKVPGSGFGTGLAKLVPALNTDFDWLRQHTRYLQRAIEWDGRPISEPAAVWQRHPRCEGLGGASAEDARAHSTATRLHPRQRRGGGGAHSGRKTLTTD